jgi:hypothetical protein
MPTVPLDSDKRFGWGLSKGSPDGFVRNIFAEIEENNRKRDNQLHYTSTPVKPMKLFLDRANGTFAIAVNDKDAWDVFFGADACGLIENLESPDPVEVDPTFNITFYHADMLIVPPIYWSETRTADEWARSNSRGIIGTTAVHAIVSCGDSK